ncbi:MAG: putative sulfate exporter family transporter [Arenimonas sp.]|nr:putative sulfate exporter family transporter [Arenimonas sp.]
MISSSRLISYLPGLALSIAVAVAGLLLERAELAVSGARPIEGLVLAIVIGTALRSGFRLSPAFTPGITFSAHFLLECAIVALGASVSFAAVREAGPQLVAGIAVVVLLSIVTSFAIGRLFGLSPKLAFLIAFGNSICGNSAIAASAPVVEASAEDVAASIAFTAVLGVVAVLAMPMMSVAAHLSAVQYGVFAGLTVYAVPLVLAATAPIGAVSLQTGTLVKLIRVLMLGPLLFIVGLARGLGGRRLSISHVLPWFIAGFAIMAVLRSTDVLPPATLALISSTASLLTTVAMAGLGLSVDVRSLRQAGGRVIIAAIASLLALCCLSMAMIALIGIV